MNYDPVEATRCIFTNILMFIPHKSCFGLYVYHFTYHGFDGLVFDIVCNNLEYFLSSLFADQVGGASRVIVRLVPRWQQWHLRYRFPPWKVYNISPITTCVVLCSLFLFSKLFVHIAKDNGLLLGTNTIWPHEGSNRCG